MHLMKAAVCFITLLLVSATAQMQSAEVVAQAYRTVNVRSGPSTEYDIIGQLNSGNEVQVTGRSDDDSNWLRINFNSKEGWVAYFTVSVIGDTGELPIVEALTDRSTPFAPASATPMVAHGLGDAFVSVFRRVNVRSGPGMEYRRIGTLEPGSSADVTGRTEDNEWLQINFAGQQGWIAYFVVSLTGEIGDIPVVAVSLSAATRVPPEVQVVTRYNINLHTQPVIGSPVLGVVPYDSMLITDARSDTSGTWLRVTYDGEQGWLRSSLVNISGSLSTLSIIPTATPTSARTD